MISRFRFLILAMSGAVALSAGTPRAGAEVVDPETHPAGKVVKEYLGMILARQWDKSADIVDEGSLGGLHKDYIARIGAARTMDDEEALIRRVGKSTVEEVKNMKPRDFYTAYHDGLQKTYKVEESTLDIIRKTLTMKLLSAALENERTIHILVRTKHANGKAVIENLELISLFKNGEKWQVALNEQAPKVTPMEGAESGGKAADPVKPAADPVKPATPPKPAAPVKPAPRPKKPATTPGPR